MDSLYFTGSLPWWIILLMALVMGALLIYQFISLKQRLKWYQSCFLVFLRGLVYALLIFFLLGPGLVERNVTKLRRPLTVLLDTSQSMNFAANPEETGQNRSGVKKRIDLVKEKIL